MTVRTVTVLHPKYVPDRINHTPPRISDYITVPHLDTIGGWRVAQMLSHREIKLLADLANRLEKERGVPARRGLRKEEVRYRA